MLVFSPCSPPLQCSLQISPISQLPFWSDNKNLDLLYSKDFWSKRSWKQRLSKLPKLPILRSGPDRMMGGAELRNLEGLGCQAKRPVGDLIFISVFDLQGLFYCSSQFLEPKWKTSCSQAVEHFQEIFNVKKAPCWLSKFFFILVLKREGKQ